MNEKEKFLIAQLKVIGAVRNVLAWIICLSFLTLIGGAHAALYDISPAAFLTSAQFNYIKATS